MTRPHRELKPTPAGHDVMLCVGAFGQPGRDIAEAAATAPQGGTARPILILLADNLISVTDWNNWQKRYADLGFHLDDTLFILDDYLGPTDFKAVFDRIEAAGGTISALMLGMMPARNRRRHWINAAYTYLEDRFAGTASITYVPLSQDQKDGRFFGLTRADLRLQHEQITWPVIGALLAFLISELTLAYLPNIFYSLHRGNIFLIFLAPTILISLRMGVIAGLVSSLLNILILNYYYVFPLNSLAFATPVDIFSIVIFFTISILVSGAAGRLRNKFVQSTQAERQARLLFRVNQRLIKQQSADAILDTFSQELNDFDLGETRFFKRTDLDAVERNGTEDTADAIEQAALEVLQEGKAESVTESGKSWRLKPIFVNKTPRAVVALKLDDQLSRRQDSLQTLAALTLVVGSLASLRQLAEDLEDGRLREEREKIRALLLSSVSHDLKTPLASIIGSLGVIKNLKQQHRLSEENHETLLQTALDEARRLDSFITNILDMTRLESGQVQAKLEAVDLYGLALDVRDRLARKFNNFAVDIQIEPGSHAMADPVLSEQVLQNILENAYKYAQDGGKAELAAFVPEHEPHALHLSVRDFGPGIPESRLKSVFNKFERLKYTDSQVPGTGLGMAIAKAMMQAQNGDITAANHPAGGAIFTLIFHRNGIDQSKDS